MALAVHPLTPARRDDLDALFDAKGCSMARSCSCLYYRETAATTTRDRDARRAALHALADRVPAVGLLAYEGDAPVGWVALSPRTEYPRLVRSPVAKAVDDLPVWSLVCFVVPPAQRGRGVARVLLVGAVAYARDQGALALEAYPIDKDPPGDAAWLWNGALSTYRKAGFVEVARRRPERPVVRRWFRGVYHGIDADDPRPALLEGLHDEIAAWERAIDAASAGGFEGGTLHDVLGHLAGWHEVTRARLRAAAARTAPAFPAWLGGGTPRSEEALHEANARLLAEQRARSWSEVLAGWRAAHAETVERLAHASPADLTTVGRFEGLPDHPLAAVVASAIEHHGHHRAQLDP